MNLTGLVITAHAREQFIRRHEYALKTVPKNPDDTLRKLMQKAKMDRKGSINIILDRRRKYGEASNYYYSPQGWRFVVVEEEGKAPVLVTVERTVPSQNNYKRR